MRICLYTSTALPKLGGQEAVVDALARNFLALGHEPFVLAPRPRLPMRANDSSLPYPVLRHPRFYSTKHLVTWYRRWLRAAQARHHFDLIHCHDVYPTGYLAGLLRKQLQIPVVITSHGGDTRAGNRRLAKAGMRLRFLQAVASADALVSIGQFTRDALLALGASPEQIVTIPNGVDREPFLRKVDRPVELDRAIVPGKYVLFLGRLAPRKGVDILLKAIQRLAITDSVQLVIAGSGDEQGNIEQQIKELHLAERVRLVGRVAGDTKTYLLQNALCTVMPSRDWEAFPLVILESYAAGRPVIGTAIPGLSDWIEDQKTGLLVAPESPVELSGAIGRLMNDNALADRLGAAAGKWAMDFDWVKIAQRHLEVYQRVCIAQKARPSA